MDRRNSAGAVRGRNWAADDVRGACGRQDGQQAACFWLAFRPVVACACGQHAVLDAGGPTVLCAVAVRSAGGVACVVVAVAIAQSSALPATALATGAEHGAPRCPGTHEKVVIADAQAVVYQAPLPREEGRGIYACAYGHRSYVLGSGLARGPASGGTGGAFGVDDETLAGPVVAYEEIESFTGGRSRVVIVVRDLRSGRVIREAPTAEAISPRDVGKDSARSLVVSRVMVRLRGSSRP